MSGRACPVPFGALSWSRESSRSVRGFHILDCDTVKEPCDLPSGPQTHEAQAGPLRVSHGRLVTLLTRSMVSPGPHDHRLHGITRPQVAPWFTVPVPELLAKDDPPDGSPSDSGHDYSARQIQPHHRVSSSPHKILNTAAVVAIDHPSVLCDAGPNPPSELRRRQLHPPGLMDDRIQLDHGDPNACADRARDPGLSGTRVAQLRPAASLRLRSARGAATCVPMRGPSVVLARRSVWRSRARAMSRAMWGRRSTLTAVRSAPAPGVVEQFADLAEDRRCNVVGPASEVCLSRSHRGGDP
jgi:hypothetical protein